MTDSGEATFSASGGIAGFTVGGVLNDGVANPADGGVGEVCKVGVR